MATNEIHDPDNLPRDAEGRLVISQQDREDAAKYLGIPLDEVEDRDVEMLLLTGL
jgi:hypothetical protein